MSYPINEIECVFTQQAMKQIIKKWWADRKQQMKIRYRDEICHKFQVTERTGKIYILCDDIAVKCMPPDANAQEICDTIDIMRTAAIEYEHNR